MVPARGLRGGYILPMKTRVNEVASHMIARAAAGTNRKRATSLCVDFTSSSWATIQFNLSHFPSIHYKVKDHMEIEIVTIYAKLAKLLFP